MAITNRQVIINLHTLSGTTAPAVGNFEVGEIVVQNTASDPALYIHSGASAVAKILSEDAVKELIDNAGVQSINTKKGDFTLDAATETAGNVAFAVDNANKVTATVNGWADLVEDVTANTKDISDIKTEQIQQNTNITANTAAIEALEGLAVTSVTEGSTNGTVKVNGTDVAVHGLGSAAYEDTTAFDEAGAAASAKTEVIGGATTDGDTLKKLEDRIVALGDNPLTGISAADSSVTVSAKANKAQTVKVNISEGANQALTLANDGLFVDGSAFDASGAAATAKSEVIGDMTGDTKTLGALQDAIEALGGNALTGLTEGNGIAVTNGTNESNVALKLDPTTYSGLTVGANGLKLADVATSAQGAKADTAVQSVTINGDEFTGTSVNLGSNYVQDSAYTHTDNNYTTDEKTKLAGISSGATKVETSNTNGHIQIDGTDATVYTHPTATSATAAAVKVGNDAEGHVVLGTALELDDMSDVVLATPANGQVLTFDGTDSKWKNVAIPAQTDYNLTAVTSPSSEYAAQYEFWKGDTKQTTINIPKDQFLKEAAFYATSGDVPTGREIPAGTTFPTLYFAWELTNGVTTPSWVPVGSLVDTYTAGSGVTLDGTTFKGVVDANNANGLSVGANGFAMAAVVASTGGEGGSNGAMTAAQAEKLAGIEAGADVNVIETVKVNGSALTPDANKAVDVTVPTQVSDLTNDSGFATSGDVTAEINKLDAEVTSVASKGITVTVGEADGKLTGVTIDATNAEFDAAGAAQDVKDVVDEYTVNNKAISTNPVLDGADVNVSSAYTKAGSAAAIASGDSMDTALGKLEYKIDSATSDALVEVEAGSGITVSTKANKKQTINAKVNTAASAGVALSNDADSGITVTVTPGSVANNDGSVVTGGAVYTAIDNAKNELKGSASTATSADTTIEGAKKYADAVAASAVDELDATATTSTVSGVTVQVTETNGKLDSAATLTITGGAVAQDNTALVNGGQVYGAIEAVKTDGSDTSASTTIAGAKLYADAVAASAVATEIAKLDAEVSGQSSDSAVTVTVTEVDGKLTAVAVDSDAVSSVAFGELGDPATVDAHNSGANASIANNVLTLDFDHFRINAGEY